MKTNQIKDNTYNLYLDSTQEIIEMFLPLVENNIIKAQEVSSDDKRKCIIIKFIYNSKIIIFNVWGIFSQTTLPKTIERYVTDNFKPDFFFCDSNDNLILSVEKTSTAPVGNALNQRANRPVYAYENNIPFMYIFPKTGYDNSSGTERRLTGSFLKLYEICNFKNKMMFSYSDSNDEIKIWKKVLDYVLNNNFENDYGNSSIKFDEYAPKWTKSEKTKPADIIVYDIVKNICTDSDKSFCIVDGAPFYVINTEFLTEKEIKILGIDKSKSKVGLIIIQGFKKNGSFSDPNTGEIALFSFLLKNYGVDSITTFIFSDSITGDKFILNKNKITNLSKMYSDNILLYDGTLIRNSKIKEKTIRTNKKNIFGEDFVTAYLASLSLLDNDIKLTNIQCPSGSWTFGNVKNNTSRDASRSDLSLMKGTKMFDFENKKDISDLYKELNKYTFDDYFIFACLYPKNINSVTKFITELKENEFLLLLKENGEYEMYDKTSLIDNML